MISKIISSGQTGVELAALDAAIRLGIAHAGWTARGRRNESGRLPAAYDLKETASVGFQEAVEKNTLCSNGVLVVSKGTQTSRTTEAIRMALRHQRQFLHIDLQQYSLFEAASLACSWLFQGQIRSVFITGPSASEEPRIYDQAKKLLETAFYLGSVQSDLHPASEIKTPSAADLPMTVEEAVARLRASLPLKDRTTLANMQPDELDRLNPSLGGYIKQTFGLHAGNEKLLQSCARLGRVSEPSPDQACKVIIRFLYDELRSTHKLRIIK